MLNSNEPWSPLPLQPLEDARAEDGGFFADSDEPWLTAQPPANAPRMIAFRYRAGRFCEPSRPRLRFMREDGSYREHLLAGVTEGEALWYGRYPPDTREIRISPTNRPGPFEFGVDYAPALWRAAARALHSPKRLFFALSAGMVGLAEEAELNWRWALGQEPETRYSKWRAERRSRAADPAPGDGIRFWIFINIDAATTDAIDATCRSLPDEEDARLVARFHGAPAPGATATIEKWKARAAFGDASSAERPDANDFVAMLRAGDRLTGDALAVVAAHLARWPRQALLFADEIRASAGSWRPVFKPGWSPTFQRFSFYLGHAAFFSGRLTPRGDWLDTPAHELVDQIACSLPEEEIGALHRPLFFIRGETTAPKRSIDAVHRDTDASVSIVVPTRDRADLLEGCLESLFERTTYRNFNVVLVDNDSVETRTHALIDRLLATEPRVTVLRAPGEFNFSALSNAGGEASDGDYLVFLNNDTRIVTPDWIERLLYFARAPDVGAVGARLLYPNGMTQHVGVVLGMGGVAGHFGAGLSGTSPGWLGQNLVPHEASAVTGACLMVARRKFDAVGRFDAVNLPVDLNDVDLCLRLRAAGWRSICNCEVELIHHESASRGGAMRLQKVYARERRYFQEKWRAVIRDDPYFHPGLSLYSPAPALP